MLDNKVQAAYEKMLKKSNLIPWDLGSENEILSEILENRKLFSPPRPKISQG